MNNFVELTDEVLNLELWSTPEIYVLEITEDLTYLK